MKLPHYTSPRPVSSLLRHTGLLAVIFGLCLTSWVGWIAWNLWNDQILPPERVTAKQLRVSESQRQQLLEDLSTYQQPTATGTVPSVPFQGGS